MMRRARNDYRFRVHTAICLIATRAFKEIYAQACLLSAVAARCGGSAGRGGGGPRCFGIDNPFHSGRHTRAAKDSPRTHDDSNHVGATEALLPEVDSRRTCANRA